MRHAARLALLALPLALSAAACDRAGPAERTGRSIDRAGERVRDAIDPPGPVERAGRRIDRAVGN